MNENLKTEFYIATDNETEVDNWFNNKPHKLFYTVKGILIDVKNGGSHYIKENGNIFEYFIHEFYNVYSINEETKEATVTRKIQIRKL